MPSNKDLKNEIQLISEKLELEIDTNGLNNRQLVETLSDLKAKERDMELETQADSAAAKEPEAKEPEAKEPEAKEPEAKEPEAKEPEAKEPEAKEPEAKEPEAKEPEAKEPEAKELKKALKIYVKKGKAITTKRGILSDGDEIKESDIHNGEKELERLLKSGYLEKK